MIASPDGGANHHIEVLAELSTRLLEPGFIEQMKAAKPQNRRWPCSNKARALQNRPQPPNRRPQPRLNPPSAPSRIASTP